MSILKIFFKLVNTLIVFHFKELVPTHFCSSAVYTLEYKFNQTFTKVLVEFEGQLKANGRRAVSLEKFFSNYTDFRLDLPYAIYAKRALAFNNWTQNCFSSTK